MFSGRPLLLLKAKCRLPRRLVHSSLPEPHPAAGLLACIVAEEIGQEFEDVYQLLAEQPEHIDEFSRDMAESDMNILHSNKELCVIRSSKCVTMVFNNNIDLCQSSAPVDPKTKKVSYTLPLELCDNRHIIGFSFANLIHHMNRGKDSAVRRAAVLGAGGCTLPIMLCENYPDYDIHAVELSAAVIHASQSYFGAATYARSPSSPHILSIDAFNRPQRDCTFTLHNNDALLWIKLANSLNMSFEMIFVDIASSPCVIDVLSVEGPTLVGELVAPTIDSLHLSILDDMLGSLASGGVIAINVLGDRHALPYVLKAVSEAACKKKNSGDVRYHLGSMTLSHDAESSNTIQALKKDSINSENSSSGTRNNSIIFLSRVSSDSGSQEWFSMLEQSPGAALAHARRQFASSLSEERRESKFPFPFERMEHDSALLDWMKCFKSHHIYLDDIKTMII